jgi:DNA primase
MKDPKEVRALINDNVSLHEIFEEVGIHLPQVIKPQQMSCPFHGQDLSMSARYYPETNSMYCFCCKEAWDPISFWMKYSETRFMAAADRLSKKYKVDLSKITNIQVKDFKITRYVKENRTAEDKRRMALYILENRLKMALPIEESLVARKMLYLIASARHIEDPVQFSKLTLPVAKRLLETLS